MTASNQGLPGDDIPRRFVRVHHLSPHFEGSGSGHLNVNLTHVRGQGPTDPTDGLAEMAWGTMLREVIEVLRGAWPEIREMLRVCR